LRNCDAGYEWIRGGSELHSALGSAESRDGNLEGDVSGRYDEIGFGDDYGYDHGGAHRCNTVGAFGQRDGERYASFHGYGSE
jgi:hypothetical protein